MTWGLVKKVFKPRQRTAKDISLQRMLQTRAWVFHVGYTLMRLLYWVAGTSIWLSDSKSCFNEEFQDMDVDDDEKDCLNMKFD